MIKFSDFSFTYKAQKKPTLKSINLEIRDGEKILILGPSGSGKSTLGNCINGLIPHVIEGKMEGSLTVNGKDVKTTDVSDLSRMVGTVLQDTDGQFVGLSVAEDIAFSLENREVEIERMHKLVYEAASIVDMEDFLSVSPDDLSGGQKQRVSLAGVLVDDVDILLFDEPLAALDPATGKKAIDLIDRVHKETGKTIIIIEHRLEDVLYRPVDRIILIDNSTIVMDTTPDILLSSHVLEESGIRPPLYISVLKMAGCKLMPGTGLASIDNLDISPYKENIRRWFSKQKVEKETQKQSEILAFDHVSYSYTNDRRAVDDISFSINKGEMISIIGKNGAGKSTIAQMMMAIFPPDSGTITIDGAFANNDNIAKRASKVGYVMQNPNHMISNSIVYDEVAFGLRLKGLDEDDVHDSVINILRICGLERFYKWPISALSFGQKKRVTIASILVMRPEILILDEPTAGQDYRRYTDLMNFIKQLNRDLGITIIFVTHDLHLALEYTSKSIVMADGKLLAYENVSSIFSNPELLKRANLKETSLFELCRKMEIPDSDIPAFIDAFILSEEAKTDSDFSSVHLESGFSTSYTGKKDKKRKKDFSANKIAFGFTYIDGYSWIHRLNGVAKFLVFLLWIVFCFATFDIRLLLVAFFISMFCTFTSKIPFKKFKVPLIGMLSLVLVNALCIYLFSPSQGTAVIGSRTLIIGSSSMRYALSLEELWYLAVVCLKLFTIFPMALLFVFCTHPSEFASSLNKIGLSYRISYSISLSLRYIPEITDDFANIMHAQEARGVDISKNVSLAKRVKNVTKVLAPLILSSIDKIDIITNAMILRGFGIRKKRTWYRERKLCPIDWIAIFVALLLVFVAFYFRFGLGVKYWYPFN